MATAKTFSAKQLAIAPITAAAAVGDMPRLHEALGQGLGAGLTISEVKEILIQLYGYAGFPRSLNALGESMKVLQAEAAQRAREALDPQLADAAKRWQGRHERNEGVRLARIV